jgi:CubicO group peptidase (beta-lactamase class C family)
MKASEQNGSTLDVVRAMAKDPLSFEPGTRYKYSLCHDVLAAVVEVVSGMRFSEYLSRYIFEPLGVVDMGFRPTEEQKSRFSALYMYKNGTGSAHEVEIQNRFIITPDYDSGGAGLFSTVDEYMKIITVIACGGTTADGYRILKPETISMMGKNHLPEAGLNDFSNTRLFGYGWGLCGRAHMNPTLSCSLAPVGEFGWDGAAAAFSMIDAKNRVALYFGTHLFGCSYGYHMVHPTIRNLVYEGINS